jgi:hypothetical protein
MFAMKRNAIIEQHGQDRIEEHKQRIAFHEAGHAAAIFINSMARNLPPVFFEIRFKNFSNASEEDALNFQETHDNSIAQVEGGRLIQSLPPSLESFVNNLSVNNEVMLGLIDDYMNAFEADIINLLIGPLAEARHVADIDDESFNRYLVNRQALTNYGGSSDLAIIKEYLQSYSANKVLRRKKLEELFTVAFEFVTDYSKWKAICKLAKYILTSNKNSITYEEVAAVLGH